MKMDKKEKEFEIIDDTRSMEKTLKRELDVPEKEELENNYWTKIDEEVDEEEASGKERADED
jgi:hypothetical protein